MNVCLSETEIFRMELSQTKREDAGPEIKVMDATTSQPKSVFLWSGHPVGSGFKLTDI